MAKFKIGDVVCVKSGGPKMTVYVIEKGDDGEPVYVCAWFNGWAENTSYPQNPVYVRAPFAGPMLVKVEGRNG